MKYLISAVVLCFLTYLLLSWALDNPEKAREIRNDVDQTTDVVIDKTTRAVDQIVK